MKVILAIKDKRKLFVFSNIERKIIEAQKEIEIVEKLLMIFSEEPKRVVIVLRIRKYNGGLSSAPT